MAPQGPPTDLLRPKASTLGPPHWSCCSLGMAGGWAETPPHHGLQGPHSNPILSGFRDPGPSYPRARLSPATGALEHNGVCSGRQWPSVRPEVTAARALLHLLSQTELLASRHPRDPRLNWTRRRRRGDGREPGASPQPGRGLLCTCLGSGSARPPWGLQRPGCTGVLTRGPVTPSPGAIPLPHVTTTEKRRCSGDSVVVLPRLPSRDLPAPSLWGAVPAPAPCCYYHKM